MSFIPTAISAPGKVLLAGGYLVLDASYSGLVFALSARIHAVSEPLDKRGVVRVRSPQFEGAVWEYNVVVDGSGLGRGVEVGQVGAGVSANPFVETTIRYVLSYIASNPFYEGVDGATITIFADNDYYSQPPSSSSSPPPRFNNLGVPISSAHKTGLGSSAALVTSLTACLLSTYSGAKLDLTQLSNQRIVHNLAQAAHCAAQGKVGSGFDVAAAVFGSCVYHRFSPAILESVGDAGTDGFTIRLGEVVNKDWDLKVEKTKVTPGLRLVMGDVDCGSSTPGMVKKVLAWRKESADVARKQWDTLEELNTGLINLLDQLRVRADENATEYAAALESVCANGVNKAVEDPSRSLLLLQKIAETIKNMRANNRAMGEAADVPIEPKAQTRLLDSACEQTKGALGGVVPGAGGYDAVAFLVVDREEAVRGLQLVLRGWAFEGSGAEGEGGKVEALATREEHEGVRGEQREQYGM